MRCAGLSVSLLIAYDKSRFSYDLPQNVELEN